jgi:hypothetical protein
MTSRHGKVPLALIFFFFAMQLRAADISANASRDATRLVACMKAFDAACVNSLTYTKMFEDRGISRDQLDQGSAKMYQQMKSLHARYALFELSAPWPPFASRGNTCVFIPYSMVLSVRGQDTVAKAFFIGISDDAGSTWKFVDGQKITQDNIKMFLPDYDGATLPPTSLSQRAAN